MATGEDAIALLSSIDSTLKAMLALAQKRTAQAAAARPKPIASDADLDGPHGNPVIKMKDPRDWTGPPMKDRRYSECPPEYLDLLADRLDWFAQKAEESGEEYNGRPVAPYKRKDASRARGWAKRMRDGKHNWQSAPSAVTGTETSDGWASDGDAMSDARPEGW